MTRRFSWVFVAVVVAGSCSYESSGTTTTTLPLSGDEPVATSPASIVAGDQRSEGSSVVVESLAMPDAGWVVARLDSGGSPGEVIGISELIAKGFTADVPVPFLVPISSTTTLHLTVHIDVDSDTEFLYEPPDAFVDAVATGADGTPATAIVTITLLPPLSPGSALLDPQVTDGTTLVLAGGLLPAPGFLVVHESAAEGPGAVLGVSELFPSGVIGEFTLSLDTPLVAAGTFMVVAWVDRNEDGAFTPGPEGDQMAVTEGGLLAVGSAEITVIRRAPAALVVADQVVESGGEFVIDSLVAPAAGFIEILRNSSGAPGTRLAVVAVAAGTVNDLAVPLPAGVSSGARLWLRLWVDFDQSGALSPADLTALDEIDGNDVQESFVVTLG